MAEKKGTEKAIANEVERIVPARVKSIAPDERAVTERQAVHLAKLASVDVKELVGRKIAEVHERLRWKIDPVLLLFRRVCGQVVKRDPGSGELHPVPNATVHVEDTDCSFLGLFPREGPWGWLFPLVCHREEIATVTTDACGRFCVYVPRWDIDRILRFRLARICWPEFVKPDIRDILEWIKPLPEPPRIRKPPRPEPDPAPDWLVNPGALQRVGELLGPEAAERLQGIAFQREFGESTKPLERLLATPALGRRMAPPLPPKMADLDARKDVATVTAEFGLEPELARRVNFSHFIGPFWRCRDVLIPEWVPIVDVPDITFRVTQDVDDDGDEETIYSEGFFDVRWNADPIPDVILEADDIALSTPSCSGPDIDPGTCTGPEIRTVGLMTLEPSHHNSTSGYGIRPNRPKPSGFVDGTSVGPAEAPYWRTLQLHGCHRFGNAKYYRLTYQYGSASEIPFTGLHWYAPRLGPGAPIHVVPDPDGWYEILPPGDLVFPYWLLNWPTGSYSNGLYKVRLQLGNSAKTVIDPPGSPQVGFEVDNTRPNVALAEIRWRLKGSTGSGQLLPDVCPIIQRPAGMDIELLATYAASATHFRDVYVSGHSCRAGWLARSLTALADRGRYEHWHTGTSDNSWGGTAIFDLPATFNGMSTQGVCSIWVFARGRAFNPAGGDAGPGTNWLYNPVYSWWHPHRDIAVIDV
ncbi:MAG: hypothetical protein E4G90_01470 [Gemmatimonadales bacterium]|nr:MAG: hypothetical protein E4G90_01470 [Gemmatimonadales bacterium]